MKARSSLTIALALAALVLTAVNIFTRGAVAQSTPSRTEPLGFGLVTLAPEQNLRLNIVNTSGLDRVLPPDPCRVQIIFVDSDGNTVGQVHTMDLAPGQSISVDALGFSTGGGRGFVRLRPIVRVDTDPTHRNHGNLPPDPCIPTLEVFDVDSGRTTLLLDGTGRAQSFDAMAVVDGR